MKAKPIIKELLVVMIIVVASLIIIWIITANFKSNNVLDVSLQDTFFVISWKAITMPVLLAITIIVYAINEAFHRYRRKLPNLVLIMSVFLINLEILSYTNFFYKVRAEMGSTNNGWTIYPPLSALPKVHPIPSPTFDNLIRNLSIIQILFIVLLVIIAFITGKNWYINNYEKRIG